MDTTPVKAYWNLLESGRFHQTESGLSPAETGGVHGFWWTPFELDILNWPMSHQLSPEYESGRFHWNMWGSVMSYKCCCLIHFVMTSNN